MLEKNRLLKKRRKMKEGELLGEKKFRGHCFIMRKQNIIEKKLTKRESRV